MLRTLGKRTFWTLSEGRSIGYIESIGNAGIIFKNRVLTFRETSSNFASREPIQCSTSYLQMGEDQLYELMTNKKQVTATFRTELIGLPHRGDIESPIYITKIEKIGDEIVTVKASTSDP